VKLKGGPDGGDWLAREEVDGHRKHPPSSRIRRNGRRINGTGIPMLTEKYQKKIPIKGGRIFGRD
jgi:hypothetical protein